MDEASLWAVLSLVAPRLDGESLARASCVSRACRELASQTHLWQSLCLRLWPSLSSPPGLHLLGLHDHGPDHGCFKHFYRRRAQAQAQHRNSCLNRCRQARLSLDDVFFLVDISHSGAPLTSTVVCGDGLRPSFVGEGHGDSSFDFSVPITCASPPCSWSKDDVQDFEVSWAVAARGSQRIYQLMNTRHQSGKDRRGVVVGNACTYTQPLPLPTECACDVASALNGSSNAMDWQGMPCEVQVRLESNCSRFVSTSPSGCTYQYSNFKPFRVSFAILHTVSWGCLSQAQALLYLQQALFHQCTGI